MNNKVKGDVMEEQKYELGDFLPKSKKDDDTMVKITITVAKKQLEDIDRAVKHSHPGHKGETPTAYAKAAFSVAAMRARKYLSLKDNIDI